ETNGIVYVADAFENDVLVYAPDGANSYSLAGEWSGEHLTGGRFGEVTGVGVDNSGGASAGDVYVVEGEASAAAVIKAHPAPEAGQEGALLRTLTKGKMEEPNGVAIDPASGRVYVADQVNGSVYEYSATGAFESKFNGSSSPLGGFGKEESEESIT